MTTVDFRARLDAQAARIVHVAVGDLINPDGA